MSKNYTPIITLAEEREEFASMLFQTLAYGAYLVVSSLSIHLLWKRRTGPGGVMLLLYTCITAVLVCVWYVSTMRKAAYDFVDIRHAPPFAEDYLCTPANLISEISSSLVVFNSDLLMIYRTYVVRSQDRRVVIFPALLLAAQVGLAIPLEAVCFSDIFPGRGPLHITRPSNVATLAAYVVLTALINLYCTIVISWTVVRLERTRRITGAEPEGDRGRLGRLVLVLVESAALYTASSIAAVVEVAAGIIYAPSTRFSGGLLISMAFLNPAIIILRLTLSPTFASSDGALATVATNISTVCFAPRQQGSEDTTLDCDSAVDLPPPLLFQDIKKPGGPVDQV